MKSLLPRLVPLVLIIIAFAATAAAKVRTMGNLPGVPVAGLRSILPSEAYARLINEPIKAWILVRGQVINSRVAGARIAHSEANGVYDKVAVQMANSMELYSPAAGTRLPDSVQVHVLVYQLPKGEHAIALAQNDAVGATNLIYSRSIMLRYLGLAGATAETKKKSSAKEQERRSTKK